jgi:deazaflavin-dependent oxidoreductase (nitroreductase family)
MNSATPNDLQKFAHRFLLLRPVSALFAITLHHIDRLVLKLTNDQHTITEIVGFPIIQLTTIGAKTGQPRTMPLLCLVDGEQIAIIGSNFGRKPNPGWYYNLKANPTCTVNFKGRTSQFVARQARGEERERYWQMALSFYKGYDSYRIRAAHREIPVMVLEPLKSLPR